MSYQGSIPEREYDDVDDEQWSIVDTVPKQRFVDGPQPCYFCGQPAYQFVLGAPEIETGYQSETEVCASCEPHLNELMNFPLDTVPIE